MASVERRSCTWIDGASTIDLLLLGLPGPHQLGVQVGVERELPVGNRRNVVPSQCSCGVVQACRLFVAIVANFLSS